MTDFKDTLNKLNKKQVEVDNFIKEARALLVSLKVYAIKVGKNADFTASRFLRGNFLGNALRSKKNNNVNKNIARVQDELLFFQKKLLLFDEKLAKSIHLPSLTSDYYPVGGKLSDIGFRMKLRLKEEDIRKTQRSMEKILRRLVVERKKIAYDIKKIKENIDL